MVMAVESQGFDGILVVVCIEGGPVTRVEHEVMGSIIAGAQADAAQSGVTCRIDRRDLSYVQFLREHATRLAGVQVAPDSEVVLAHPPSFFRPPDGWGGGDGAPAVRCYMDIAIDGGGRGGGRVTFELNTQVTPITVRAPPGGRGC
eukprot:COSAG01_NODE_42412_length_440_cov_0.947214_1_plen_146_part_10